MEPLFEVREVSEILRLSRQSIYALVRSGKLRAYRIGRRWMFEEGDIRTFMSSVSVEVRDV
jgi:excisionase family DNA binding protein